MINGLLVTNGFVYRFLWMSSTNEVEQLCPNWLTGNELDSDEKLWALCPQGYNTSYLDSLPPFSIFIMSNQQERTNPI